MDSQVSHFTVLWHWLFCLPPPHLRALGWLHWVHLDNPDQPTYFKVSWLATWITPCHVTYSQDADVFRRSLLYLLQPPKPFSLLSTLFFNLIWSQFWNTYHTPRSMSPSKNTMYFHIFLYLLLLLPPPTMSLPIFSTWRTRHSRTGSTHGYHKLLYSSCPTQRHLVRLRCGSWNPAHFQLHQPGLRLQPPGRRVVCQRKNLSLSHLARKGSAQNNSTFFPWLHHPRTPEHCTYLLALHLSKCINPTPPP